VYFKKTSERGKLPAGLLAILVHVAFFILLVFGVTWHTQSPAPVTVDLWESLPSTPKAASVEPAPRPKEETPPPEPKPKPKPEPKAEPEPAPKPDIALKEKEEKKKLEEKKRKQELEKKREEESKKEEERERQEKLKEEQAKKLAAQKEAQAKARAEQAATTAADAKVNDYVAKIQAKIRSNTIIPPDVVGNPEVVYEITLLPTGEVLEVRLVKGSGFSSYDAAAERAIRKSQPLPIPKDDPSLFANKFRVGNYSFRPND
jgi:colicin import membrane protein